MDDPVRTAQVLDELLPMAPEEDIAPLAEPVETSDADVLRANAEQTRYLRILAQLSRMTIRMNRLNERCPTKRHATLNALIFLVFIF